LDTSLPALDNAASVAALEACMLQMPQVDLSTTHLVHGGMCARTIFIPAGTVLTGALTNCDNICVVYGTINVTTDSGMQTLTGFNVLPASKGYKRAGLALTDTWWTMVWPTELTDIDAIEDEMTSESGMLQTRRAGIGYATPDQIDYGRFVIESGIPPTVIAAAMSYTDDLVVTDECHVHVEMRDSPIHGRGLFAKHSIPHGSRIGPMQVDGKRAVAGRWTNHSGTPNAQMVRTADGLDLYALCDIPPDTEVTLDYRQALRVNNILEALS
jgi:hypothetical protein